MSSADQSEVTFSELGRRSTSPSITCLMTMALENPRLLSLAAGFTDNRTLPVQMISDAVAELARRPGEPEHLQYGTNQGRPGLRRLVAQRISLQDGVPFEPVYEQQTMITNGSQQALYLAMQTLCDPGDIVLVDRPSYFVFLEMLSGLGIEARSLPVNEAGRLDAEQLHTLLQDMRKAGSLARVKAVYFVSYFSNPSGRSLTEQEKISLAEVLAAERVLVPVIEDAAYRELFYEQPHPARSILSLGAFERFPRLYAATLTKPFATGLKVGFGLCTDEAWRAKMLHVKGHHDFGTANFNQAIFECILANGNFDRELAILRSMYLSKMHALDQSLEQGGLMKAGWTWMKPSGGLYLWLKAPAELETGLDSKFCQDCIEAGVLYVPGELCFGDRAERSRVRLSFGVLGEGDLQEAGRRFATVAGRFT